MPPKRKYRIKYQTITVAIEDPRTGVCQGCHKSVWDKEIRTTQMHHFHYAYKPETVKKDPQKAIENTIELCYYCHKLADAIRTLLDANVKRIYWVITCHPKWADKKFLDLAKLISENR